MLYHLLFPLSERFGVLNVFQYITFRTAGAAMTALVLSLLFGPMTIRWLKRMAFGQTVREVGPESHLEKSGTPTMGGVLIVGAVVLSSALWARLDVLYVVLALIAIASFGTIGFLDDWLKIRRRSSDGLSARGKIVLQVLIAGGIGAVLFSSQEFPNTLTFPFFKDLTLPLGALYPVLVMLVLVATTNTVNLTDGLDGLAIGATLIAAATYAIFTYIAGNSVVSNYLQVAYVPGVGEVAVFCGAMVGASLGFLWFNCHPAEVFMGDTGSLALGGAIGLVAVLAKQEILLLLVGGLFVMEGLSVIVQVASFKLTGRRVLRMAPLHHHFELSGWAEPKVIVRLWIIALLFALASLSTLKLR